ncbi:hypothetical protein ES319_D10G293800v1 [Gossypium barbadense]|uniref:Uncharacterized protein n=1 Tax=Gossypium barbadense TaxID=3634 RepID=A0A5J5PWT9_GOSBA|nr:hypothetical protein ES319_D10G293800v1 [Gossypium barbadense]
MQMQEVKMPKIVLRVLLGLVGGGKIRFSFAIDSWYLLMFADQISSIFWLLHSDLHEVRVTAVLEYLLSLVASLEPSH